MEEIEETSEGFDYGVCPICMEDSITWEQTYVTGSEPHLLEPGPIEARCWNPVCDFTDEM